MTFSHNNNALLFLGLLSNVVMWITFFFSQAEAQKKKAKDRDRRKDFEIQTLKSKLTNREEELCRATSRLVSMETTLVSFDWTTCTFDY